MPGYTQAIRAKGRHHVYLGAGGVGGRKAAQHYRTLPIVRTDGLAGNH